MNELVADLAVRLFINSAAMKNCMANHMHLTSSAFSAPPRQRRISSVTNPRSACLDTGVGAERPD
jgi:hypothetical protein